MDFIAVDLNFEEQKKETILSNLIVTVVIGFLTIASIYAMLYAPRRHYGNRVNLSPISGMAYMDLSSVVIIIVFLLILGAVGFYGNKAYHKERKFVVGVKFLDKRKEIVLTTKMRSGAVQTQTYRYSELILKRDDMSDGMTGHYKVITFEKDGYWMGHIYLDHFTWNGDPQRRLTKKLGQVIQYRK